MSKRVRTKKRRAKNGRTIPSRGKKTRVWIKGLLFSGSALLLGGLCVFSTYAWYTSTDQHLNRVVETTGEFDIRLLGNYTSMVPWMPGYTTENQIQVENSGESPVIVRVSLYEFFLSFDRDVRDQSGNGNLATTKTVKQSVIDPENRKTWKVGNSYAREEGTYYTAHAGVIPDMTSHKNAYQYESPTTTLGLAYRTFQWNTEQLVTQMTENKKEYWFYQDGYFYYSEVLAPGQKTAVLLKGTTIDERVPNMYKGALYQVVPVADAHDCSSALIDDWQISNTPIETMYASKLVS